MDEAVRASPPLPDAPPVAVVISGGAGQIAYSLIPLVLGGKVFGDDVRVSLRLLDIPPAAEALRGVAMEIQDATYDLLADLVVTTDPAVAFSGVDIAILLGGFPRKAGMERKELIARNVPIFKAMGEALRDHAKPDVRVLVVANPANTNCLMCMRFSGLPETSFSCLTRLDQQRLVGMICDRLSASSPSRTRMAPSSIRSAVVLGNHSSTQVPFSALAEVRTPDGGWQPLLPTLSDHDRAWLTGPELRGEVQTRGAAVINARKLSSALSAAAAVGLHVRDWVRGTGGEVVSMGVVARGLAAEYGVPDGIVSSLPVAISAAGEVRVVRGVALDDDTREALAASVRELEAERDDAMEVLGAAGSATVPGPSARL